MNDFATLAPFLWWVLLLASTAIILHDLANKVFVATPSDKNLMPNKPPQDVHQPLTTGDLIKRSIEISSTGFQREAAEAIVAMALSSKRFPLTKIPETKPDMMNQLFVDAELREFIEVNSWQTPKKIERGKLKQELELTYKMLERAERLFK
jgi:hypothetical protein